MPEYQERGVVFEDLNVGDLISTIHWFVTPDDIKMAAEAFFDDNPLYYDQDFAKETEWKGIIAPFYFLDATFRWVVFLSRGGMRHGNHTINAHGTLENFLPVRPGDRLVGKMWVEEKFEKRGKNFLTWRMEVLNEDGEMVARKFWRSYWTNRSIEFPKKESYR
jgi:3-hydroxybutyryl-CoA dehydratase